MLKSLSKPIWFCLGVAAIGLTIILSAGFNLCKSSNHSVSIPMAANLEKIELREIPGKSTIAWVMKSGQGKAFLLAHGNSADRNAMIPRAKYLHALGYTVIIPDLNAHGETLGTRKTFGYNEALDIQNAFFYLKNKLGIKWVCGIGTSLGGAALLKAESDGVEFDGLILESVYADIRTAARNRLELSLGKPFGHLESLLTWQLPLWTRLSRNQFQPNLWAKKCNCPALVLCGLKDLRAKPEESKMIFANIPNPKKRIIRIDGARHEDLFAFDSLNYKIRVDEFVAKLGRIEVPR